MNQVPHRSLLMIFSEVSALLFDYQALSHRAVPWLTYQLRCQCRQDQSSGRGSIACLSVNDAFVMGAWGEAQNASEIIMVADGNAQFTDAMGLTLTQPIRDGQAQPALCHVG